MVWENNLKFINFAWYSLDLDCNEKSQKHLQAKDGKNVQT